MSTKVLLPDDWLEHLGSEFEKPYMKDLKARLLADKKAGKKIYPPGPLILNAFIKLGKRFKSCHFRSRPLPRSKPSTWLCFSVLTGL